MNTAYLEIADYLVIIFYFLLIGGVSWFFILKRSKSKEVNALDYFLSSRNLGWFAIGASLFASNIGSEHLIGLTGAGAAGDFPVAQFEILAALMLIILAWVFVPVYLQTGIYTMPEFLQQRYDSWSRSFLTWISLAGYILTKISLTVLAGGIMIQSFIGIDFWPAAIGVVVITGLYTLAGGLTTVIYTDLVQMFVIIGGSLAILWFGLDAVGGWNKLIQSSPEAYTSLWRPSTDTNYPWTGIILGAPILGIWYWCTDQFIVQRVLAGKNVQNSQYGSVFAGWLKLLPLFLFVFPGIIAYQLSTGPDPVFSFPQIEGKENYDAALPLLTMHLLPIGLRGLVVAGLLAALMSSLSSVFHSASTLFTFDVYKRYKSDAAQKELVRVGRISILFIITLSLIWIPFLQSMEGGIFQKLQSIQSYISPPIAAVFIFGVFGSRATARGAKITLFSGAILGALRLIMEFNKDSLPSYIKWYAEINFLHFAFFLFIISGITLIATGKGKIHWWFTRNLMYSSKLLILTILLILSVIAMWLYFI